MSTRDTSAPWQYQWKRPQWQKVECRLEEASLTEGTPVAHVAAYLRPEEITSRTSEGVLTLTVTLLQSMQKNSSKLADAVELKVIEQQTDGTCHVLQSRVLRWPTTELVGIENGNEQHVLLPDLHTPARDVGEDNVCFDPLKNCTQGNPFLALFSFGYHKRISAAGKVRRKTPQHGLIGAALMRMSTQHASTLKSDQKDEIDSNNRDLVLACLSAEGRIHIYSACRLLQDSESAATSTSQDLEESMASFLFGRSLLTTVQKTILPLSQPDRTMDLSLPYLQRNNRQSFTADQKVDQARKKQPLLGFLDASTWNPVLDPATLIFQTVHNVPTMCVAAIDFLVVAGKGRQRWLMDMDENTEIEASKPEDTEEMNVAEKRENVILSKSNLDKQSSEGGFVSFFSLQSYSEIRTVFVPFAPQKVSPLIWGSLRFLLVVGQGHAVAIHMSDSVEVPQGEAPSVPIPGDQIEQQQEDPMHPKKSTLLIQQFQVLPIDLAGIDSASNILVGSDIATSPPGIALLFQDSVTGEIFIKVRSFDSIDLIHYGSNKVDDDVVVITTTQEVRHTTTVVAPCGENIWCHLSQGWCLVGFAEQANFVCFEGSNSESGAYITELTCEAAYGIAHSVISTILPVDTMAPSALSNASRLHMSLSFTDAVEDDSTLGSDKPNQMIQTQYGHALDPIIMEAMASISYLSYPEKVAKQYSLSHKEKSRRLLRQCTSWMQLEQSPQSQPRLEVQIPVISIETMSRTHCVLTLRSSAVEHGPAAPFQDILAWLSQKEDYFTASSLALDLIRDVESLECLWGYSTPLEKEKERPSLDGLLDGIIPIYGNEDINISPPFSSTLQQVADMTVVCLIKGGNSMSSTLEQFLVQNIDYDPSRASLMLVAMASTAMADDEAQVCTVIDESADQPENILWPIRCLMKVGVARNYLVTALMLLNAAIPDELRRRTHDSGFSDSVSSMNKCKSLVELIIGASPEAAEIFLNLIDEQTQCRFWDSLQHETRLVLSLVSISNQYLLLLDPEVRSWGLEQLEKCIEAEHLGTNSDENVNLRASWLRELVSACFLNAGCNINEMLHSSLEEQHSNSSDEDCISQHRDLIIRTRKALLPTPGSGGLDFGLVIPTLLVLECRNALLEFESKTSPRCILNAACYLAGRRIVEEPLFALNSSTLMKQCTLLGDIEAGAHLIGGRNGLVLECCHIMIVEVEMDMEEAERYLLSGIFLCTSSKNADKSDIFSIQTCHRRIIFLLEEHVLSVRTFGEFDTTQSRGMIDPVFAATVCLRTWWVITRERHLSQASAWLISWLRQKLSLTEKSSVTSPYRLVCAALVRALIWPEQRDGNMEAILAYKLQLDSSFVMQLSQSCCGLVEALPDYISADDYKKNAPGLLISVNETNAKRETMFLDRE